jgi:hypothetical protein
MNRIPAIAFYSLKLGLLLLAGCSRTPADRLPVFPVEGQVLWEGRPLAGALVIFHPQGGGPKAPHPTGYADKEGKFRLTTYTKQDGAPSGPYSVTVEWRQLVIRGEDVQCSDNLVPACYASSATTTLMARVKQQATAIPSLVLRR